MGVCRCGHSEGYHASDFCVADVDLGVRCRCERFVAAPDSCVKPEPPQVVDDVVARVRAEVARIDGRDMPFCADCGDREVRVATYLADELVAEVELLRAGRDACGAAHRYSNGVDLHEADGSRRQARLRGLFLDGPTMTGQDPRCQGCRAEWALFVAMAIVLLAVLAFSAWIIPFAWSKGDGGGLPTAIVVLGVGVAPAVFWTWLTFGSAVLTRRKCPKHGGVQ